MIFAQLNSTELLTDLDSGALTATPLPALTDLLAGDTSNDDDAEEASPDNMLRKAEFRFGLLVFTFKTTFSSIEATNVIQSNQYYDMHVIS